MQTAKFTAALEASALEAEAVLLQSRSVQNNLPRSRRTVQLVDRRLTKPAKTRSSLTHRALAEHINATERLVFGH